LVADKTGPDLNATIVTDRASKMLQGQTG